MSYSDLRKKHGITSNTESKTGNTNKSQSGGGYAALQKKYGISYDVDEKYLTTFISDTNSFFDSINDGSISFNDATSRLRDLSARYNTVEGWLYQNKSNLDEESYKALYSLRSKLAGIQKYYSQWETEDDYIKGASENSGVRQQRYEANQNRVKEIESELPWYGNTFLPSSVEKLFLSKEKDALVDERDTLNAENLKYKRGEDGYTTKAIDDHGKVTLNSDFDTRSTNRNYSNSSKEDMELADLMNDSTTWQWDADRVYRDAYGNELVLDENGNYYSPAAPQVKVEDKLALYLNTSEEERVAAAADVSGKMDGTWKSLMREGYNGAWEYLTEQEMGIYYYYLEESQESADKYLSDMVVELNRRRTLDQIGQYNTAYDEANLLEKIFLNAGTIPAKFVSTATGFIEDSVDTIMGNDINPYSSAHGGMHYSQTIRGNTAEELDATGFKIPIIDFSLGDIYQTGMSRLDSALATKVFGGGGTVFLGMGAAEEEAYKLYKQGASAEQITVGALSAGAAEAIWEYLSYGNLKEIENIDNPGAWVKSVLVQGWNELTEEAATEVSNILTNALIMGSQSDLAELYKENEGKAFRTFLDLAKQTAQAGFGGFLGGMGAGITQSTGVYVDTTSKYRDAGRTIMGAEGGVDALKQLANDVAGVSDAKMQKALNKQAGNVTGEIATGKNIVGKAVAGVKNSSNATKVGRLYNTVNTANNLANASANQADIAKSLQRKGFNAETANDIAEALVAEWNGQELTDAQEKLLKSAKDSKVVQDAISNIMTNEQSTMGQRSQNIRDFQEGIKVGTIAKRAGVSKDMVKELLKVADSGGFTADVDSASEIQYEVSVDGKWVNTKTGDTVEPQGLVQAADGTYMINAKDADPLSSGEVSYPDADHAIVYETFLNLEHHYGKTSRVIADMDLASRNELLGLYNREINKDGGKFIKGILDAFFYGHRNVDMSAASKDSPIWELTEQQRKIAWNTGRAAGIKTDTKVQDNVDIVYAEAEQILESGKAKKGSYHAVLEDGISPTELNDKQRAIYRYADDIAQGIQTKIRVYKGKNKAQGFYNHQTDEIWLNLNAANTDREHIMAFTLAHELVHRAKKGSHNKYMAFTEFLVKEYGKQGADLDAMIAEQIQAANEFDKTVPEAQRVNMTREKALEEVICDACQRMLLDTNAGQKLAEFGAQSKENKGFLEDLKRWITELLDRLRNYFRHEKPDSLAGKAFDNFDANVKQMLADMYVDMSIDAGEKLSTIKAAFGEEFADKFFGIKDIRYNLAAVDSHKAKLEKAYSEDSSTDLKTLVARYDKIIEIWTRLGGELNSKFLADWNSKVGKDRTFTIFKAQVGYKYNVELSSMCKKGVPLFEAIDTIVKQEVMKELGTEVLGKAEKEILYDILKQHSFEIPCAICYVEQARQREGVIIDAFLNGKVEKNAKGETTKVKLGWNQVLDSIQKEMKANGVNYTFAQVSRDIATEKYTPANLDMDMKTQAAFYAALKKIANKEIARYNKAEGKRRKLLSEVTPEAVKSCFKGTLPANLKIFKVLFNEPSSRFKIQNDLLYSSIATQNLSMAHNELYGLFNSQGGVSGYKTKQGTTIYWGDILGKSWKPDIVRDEGGVRNQSNSDSQMFTLLDQAQMYIDFTAKGYYLQAYTKVLSALKLFGLSRSKMNASLIPKVVVYKNADGSDNIEKTMATAGLDENGNPIYDDIEGINHNEAFMLIEDPEYSKNICGICIGYSDAHIFKLLDDPRVQQIIGFHDKTDDGTKRYKGARYAKNYNGLNEATKVDSEGKTKTVHIGFNSYVKRAEKKFKFNAETETFEGTVNYNGKTYTADDIPRLAADLYLEMCAKKEYTPAYADFSGHRNYYKLLADFGLYDSQGHYAPHRKVLYNMPDTVPYLDANGKKQTMRTYDYIKAELEKELAVRDSIAAALTDTSSEGIIPQFKAEVKKRQEEKSFSLPKVDSDGNKLSAEQQEFFKDSVVRDADGKLMVMYHGTANGGAFTVFDGDKLGNRTLTSQIGQGFYFTNVKKEAESYMKNVDIYGRVSNGKNPNLHQVHLNITNPFNVTSDTLDIEKAKSVYMDGNYDYFFDSYIPFYMEKKTLNGRTFTKADIQAMSKADKVSAYVDYLSLFGTKEVLSNMVQAFHYNTQSKLLTSMKNRLGYDGIVEEFKPGQYQYVAFSSEQIKNVDNQNPTTDPDIRYSLPKGEPAPTFYSLMAKVVDGLKQEKHGAASVVSTLRNKGVKAEEIKWSGIEAWLEGKKSVTKAELQEFIAGSMLQIEEEVLDNKDRPYTEDQQKRLDEYEAKRDEVAKRLADEWKKITGDEFSIRNAGAGLESAVANKIIDANKEHKDASFEGRLLAKLRNDLQKVIENNDDFGFDSWKDALRSIHRHRRDFVKNIDASTNDKAVIVKYCNALNAYNELPNMISDDDAHRLLKTARETDPWNRKIMEVKNEYNEESAKHMTNWGQYRLKGGENYREMLFRIPGSNYTNEAMMTHWKDRKGVLAHARVQDMNTFLGKMLFIEEVQSDWHNAGHKDGYRDPGLDDKYTLAKKMTDYTEAFYASPTADMVRERIAAVGYEGAGVSMILNFLMDSQESMESTLNTLSRKGASFTESEVNEIAKYAREYEEMYHQWETAPGDLTAPDAPFKDTYHEYVLKRLLREAAEQDYDSIGWTTADVQMDRWNPKRKTNEQMGIEAKNPNAVAFDEAYRNVYDRRMKKFLSDFGDKWGTQVGKTVLDNGTEVWSMAITDSMKDSVLYEGQVVYSLPKAYDSSKPFADQVDDWLNGTFPEIDTLLVGGTPDVLKKIGVPSLPITIAQRNLKDNLLGQYRGSADEIADHLITPDELKDLPAKIADPVAIIVDRRQVRGKWTVQESTIDILVEMEINGKQALVPIRMNGNSVRNGVQIDANVIASIHGNRDTLDRLDYALRNDSDDNVMVFYANKKKTTAVLRKAGYTITGWPNISDGFIHSISDPGSPVKLRIQSQTETRQFKRWFSGSKVVNKDGNPRIVYHHTNAEFWSFDTERSGSNQGQTLGDGIYLSTSPDMFSYAGKNRMELYAVIRKPFEMKLTKKQATYVLERYAAKKHNLDQYDGLYRNHAMEKLTSPVRVFDYLSQYAAENGIKVSDILKDLGYDGVHSGSEWVAFDATQVKSATDNIGTFDGDNPDIRYKLPVGEDASPRALLANAFEGLAQNDSERNKIQEYKEKVALINAEEQKLRELNEQIKELSFAKGKRDTKKISALRFDALQASNRINTYDKQLLRLEASKPMQDVLAREKRLAYKKAEQRGKEALKAYREAERKRDEQWHSEVKDKYQASKKKAIETREKRDAREKLQKLVLDTVKWITYPTKTDVKCPDILKQPYADFLNGIDLSSKRLANGGDPTKNDLRMSNAMDSLATALDRIMTAQDPAQETDKVLDTGYLDLPANFVKQLRDMNESIKAMMVDGDYVVNTMTASEVRKLSQMIRTLNHAIKTMSNLYANLRFANVEALGFDTMDFIDALGEIEKTGGIKDFVQWDNALPYYAFKRFGKGGESVFEGLMDAQDKLAFLAQEIFNFRDNAWTGEEAKAWSEDTHTIKLPNGSELTLTTADAMSIYCLSRREQGLQHLLGGGTRVLGIQEGSKKAKDSRSLLTIKDIDAINSSLTDRQRQVAESIQEFMSTVCSDWGNEISMKRFLTKEFTEKFYFPIESNDENLPTKDPAAQQSDLFRLLNISATKPLTQGANNEVIIRNIFDVFTGHASDMARLNAYGMALLDYMKWLNYREKTVTDEGQVKVRGVRKSMEQAFGNAAKSYVLNLIKDVNGRPSDGGLPGFYTRMLRNAKTAMVGNSLRVATLQVTSYQRAALVLSPKSLALGLSKKPNIEKAKKYCGIALWKSFGFYDTNISRSIEDQMKGVTNVKQKLIELSLKGAEWGDAITWGALWNACEYEVASTKKFKVGTEEFYQEVGKKLREVVYRTQVVDSTLTRSEMMRSKNTKAQELSAFMSEPTLSANILMDAGFEFNMEKRRTGSAKAAWKKTGAYVGRAVAVYSISQLAAALLEGLWDAWRDDEDEEFWKKFQDAFVENLILDVLPFNKIPIISDFAEAIMSLVGLGYFSSDNLSSTAISQAVSAVDAWKDALSGESSVTVYGALYKSTRAISSFLGWAASGIMREAVALWNNTAGAYDPTLKILTYDRSKGEKGDMMLDAMIKGDARLVERLKAEFADKAAYSSAVRTAIKDRYDAGKIDSNTAEQYLVKFGGLEDDDAYWKVQEWEYETETGEDFKKYNDFYTAVQTGKDLKAVIKRYTDNGVEAKTLASQITSYFKPLYKEMSNTERAAIKGYLLNAYQLLGYNRSEKSKDIDKWVKD